MWLGYETHIRVPFTSRPHVFLLNHTDRLMEDVFLLRDTARHLFKTTGIRSCVIINKNSNVADMILGVVKPHYIRFIRGSEGRVRGCMDALAQGLNVFIFVVHSTIKGYGGTGVYHIINESRAPSQMWLMRYEGKKAIVETLGATPPIDTCDDPKQYIHSIARHYTKFTGHSYDVGFAGAM